MESFKITAMGYKMQEVKTEASMSCSESFTSDSDGKESAFGQYSCYTAATSSNGGGEGLLDPGSMNFGACYSDVLYCKARGMPLDHIGSNAILYFDKGFERVHGAELKCSHPSCMRDGIKFRYCKHCNKPVAKRNFRKRHAHPELIDHADDQVSSSKNSSSYQQHQLQQHQELQQQQFQQLQQQHGILIHEPPLPPLITSQQYDHNQDGTTPLLKNSSTMMMISMPPLLDNSSYNNTNSSHIFASSYQNTGPNCGHGNVFYESNELRCQQLLGDLPPALQAWIDLYQKRPIGGNFVQQQEWLQKVMAVAELGPISALNTNRSELTVEVEAERSISNSINAVKEEFCRSFPPKFVNCEDIVLEQGMPQYRIHGESLALQINTDLDLFGTNAITLDSNGSIVISCSSQSYRENLFSDAQYQT